jgi:hypothetical protein
MSTTQVSAAQAQDARSGSLTQARSAMQNAWAHLQIGVHKGLDPDGAKGTTQQCGDNAPPQEESGPVRQICSKAQSRASTVPFFHSASRSWRQGQRAILGLHDGEVSSVERGDFGDGETLCGRDH